MLIEAATLPAMARCVRNASTSCAAKFFGWVAMEVNIAFNPVYITLLSSSSIVLHLQLITYLIKQLGGYIHVVFIRKIRVCEIFTTN